MSPWIFLKKCKKRENKKKQRKRGVTSPNPLSIQDSGNTYFAVLVSTANERVATDR
jgi:hypothetical protein